MNKTGHRAAAAVALAAMAVGAAACGGGHGPKVPEALAQKPPMLPAHNVGIPGSEQRELAPLPRKLRQEIVFSGVRYSTKAIKMLAVARPNSALTIPRSEIIGGAGERGWGCVSEQQYPVLPASAVASAASGTPLAKLLALVPGLKSRSEGVLLLKAKSDLIATAVVHLAGANQAIVGATFSPSTGGSWHLDWLTAGQVTQCG